MSMLDTGKAIGKQYFGAKYEAVRRSVLMAGILFFALYAAEIRFAIAPQILYLTASVFSGGIMWEVLTSRRNTDFFAGLFMLPFDETYQNAAIVLVFSAFTLITRSLPVLAVFYAAGNWTVQNILFSVLFAVISCITAAAMYTLICGSGRRTGSRPETGSLRDPVRKAAALIWAAGMYGSLILGKDTRITAGVMFVCLILALMVLRKADPYVFYRPEISGRNHRRQHGKAGVFRYLVRVLSSNPAYMINTLILGAFAFIFPYMLGQMEDLTGFYIIPMGFAMLCMNTPLCTMISGDPDTEQSLRMLPEQMKRFVIRYGSFIFLVNACMNGIYLISWQIRYGSITAFEIILAAAFAAVSAACSAALEWKYPVRGWKVETDLWHHPRKYLVPAVMLLISVLIGVMKIG